MKNLTLLLLILSCYQANAQSFGISKSCNRNVNDFLSSGWPVAQSSVINSSFKFSTGQSQCSGTLINRFTNENEIGFYFLTAKHCFDSGTENELWRFMFNYQSPTGVSEETMESNQGNDREQTKLFDGLFNNDDYYEYYHESYVEKIEDYFWGDFALFKILTPIPPHFNVTFAGWNPSAFLPAPPSTCYSFAPTIYTGIHHPRGDIKKVSGVNNIIINYTNISTGCYTVTTIIDFLFSWIWGNTASTQVICNYVDVPWLTIPLWCYGIVEDGSSGSGLFNENNRLIGVLSGSISGCVIPGPSTYGKFHNNYVRQAVKNTLNPGNSQYVDIFGLPPRKIECYNYLELPGVPGVSGEYFPAKNYQADNKVILRSATDIDVTQPIIIYPEADYEFYASGEINLNGNVDIMEDAEFETFASPCQPQRISSPHAEYLNMMKGIKIPSGKESKKVSYAPSFSLEVYPNPSEDQLNIKLKEVSRDGCSFHISVTNLIGQQMNTKVISCQNEQGKFHATLDVSDLPAGVYIIIVEAGDKLISGKFIRK